MKRAPLSWAVLWVSALAGCDGSVEPVVHSDESVFIKQVVKPDATACTYAAEPTADSVLRGTLDLAFARRYRAALLVGNSTSSRVGMTDAGVTLIAEDGSILSSSSAYLGGFVDAKTGDEPGWGVVLVDLIDDPSLPEALGFTSPSTRSVDSFAVLAEVTVGGSTSGGGRTTSTFRFPIDVCHGCLVTFPVDATDPALATPNCLSVMDTPQQTPCFVGQDDDVDCRICKAEGFAPDMCNP